MGNLVTHPLKIRLPAEPNRRPKFKVQVVTFGYGFTQTVPLLIKVSRLPLYFSKGQVKTINNINTVSSKTIVNPQIQQYILFRKLTAAKEQTADCFFELSGHEGEIDSDLLIHNDTLDQALRAQKPVDCTWVVTAMEGSKVYLQIALYELEHPNDCTFNKIEIYKSATELEGRSGKPKEYCGSQAENIKSDDNILAIRLQTLVTIKSLASQKKKLSKFIANYTVFRDLSGKMEFGTKTIGCKRCMFYNAMFKLICDGNCSRELKRRGE